MMARPRGDDWLGDEIAQLARQKVTVLVCLLEAYEQSELGLQDEAAQCAAKGIRFVHFPIQDRNIPTSRDAFKNLVGEISTLLDRGENVVIHCRMGIGRTSLLAAGILVARGHDPSQVFDFLSKKRTVSVPDTEEQAAWLRNVAPRLFIPNMK